MADATLVNDTTDEDGEAPMLRLHPSDTCSRGRIPTARGFRPTTAGALHAGPLPVRIPVPGGR